MQLIGVIRTLVLVCCAYKMTLSMVLIALPDATHKTTAQHGCVFCDIIAGKEPSTVIYETKDIVVIKKRRHSTYVDCLIIPKKHIENLFAWNEHDPYDACIMNHIMEVARHIATMITGKGHFTLVNNNGVDAHQTVFHMHWHFQAPQSKWKAEVTMKSIKASNGL